MHHVRIHALLRPRGAHVKFYHHGLLDAATLFQVPQPPLVRCCYILFNTAQQTLV
jgi:hypothetical protein